MPRFALLIHDAPRGMHYDFFLEVGDVLKTWALPQPAGARSSKSTARPWPIID